MEQKLITKTDYAKKCNVDAAAVTRAQFASLRGALVDKFIDENHPKAIAYYEYHAFKKTNYYANRYYWQIVEIVRDNPEFNIDQTIRKIGKKIKGIEKIYELAKIETLPLPGSSAKFESAKKVRKKCENLKLSDEKLQKIAPSPSPSLSPSPAIKNTVQKITSNTIPDDIRDVKKMTIEEVVEEFGTKLDYKLYVDAVKNIELIHEKRLKNSRTMGQLVSKELVKVGIIDRINSAHIKLLTDGVKTMAIRAMAMTHAGRDQQEVQEFMKDQVSSFIKPMKAKIDMSFKNIEKLTNL